MQIITTQTRPARILSDQNFGGNHQTGALGEFLSPSKRIHRHCLETDHDRFLTHPSPLIPSDMLLFGSAAHGSVSEHKRMTARWKHSAVYEIQYTVKYYKQHRDF